MIFHYCKIQLQLLQRNLIFTLSTMDIDNDFTFCQVTNMNAILFYTLIQFELQIDTMPYSN